MEEAPFRSHRHLSEEVGIPRTTLQHWQGRKDTIDAAPEVVDFFESSAGVAFLHRVVMAAHFVMTQTSSGGIRPVCLFLELSHLNRFVGASYSPHQKVSKATEQAISAFEEEESQRLSKQMRPKQIAVCEDETFHPEICLVAIEPVSNFILLEKYAQSRTAQEWNTALKDAIGEMPIEVVQSTSDEARGICRHVKEDLGVHHSPDLLHVQAEVVKATSAPLASKTRQTQKGLEEAEKAVNRHKGEKEAYLQGPRPPGRPPSFDQRILKAEAQTDQAKDALESATARQQRAKEAIQGISQAYHPYDLETGAPQIAEDISASLESQFSQIETVAGEAHLPQRCFDKIKKAKKVVVDMVATIAFFWLMVQAKIEALGLSPEIEQAVYEHLIPGIYLSLVAQKAKEAHQRHILRQRSQRLLVPLSARDGPFEALENEDKMLIEQVALDCARLFQRSSSCVEGRNGHLALRHHSLHRISDQKLKALTTVHNYFVKRPDGTTAAERFFGAKPKDLFEWVLERVELPGRPAQKRPQLKPESYLPQASG